MPAIFTGGSRNAYKVLIKIVKRKDNERLARLEYLNQCDHSFTFEEDRNRLSEVMMEWIRQAGF
jgi:hypothetical protein